MEVNTDMNNISTEPTSELVATYSQTHCRVSAHLFVYVKKTFLVHSQTGVNLPSQLHVVMVKHLLKCRAATTVGMKLDLVKW